jgi:hypothetical protein
MLYIHPNYKRIPVRPTKSDEISKNVTRNPTNIYIGTYSLLTLVLKSMSANKPRIKGNKFNIILLNKKSINVIARYSEKSIVKNIFLTLYLAGKIVIGSFAQLVWLLFCAFMNSISHRISYCFGGGSL